MVVKKYPLLSHHPRMKTKLQGEIGLLQDCLEGIEKVYNAGVIDGFDKTRGSWSAHIGHMSTWLYNPCFGSRPR